MNLSALLLVGQLCGMSHADIYDYTLKGLHQTIIIDGQPFRIEEANPLAKPFLDAGMPDVDMALSCVAWAGIGVGLAQVDHDRLHDPVVGLHDVVLAALVLAEMDAMHQWRTRGFGPPEVQWTFARIYF